MVCMLQESFSHVAKMAPTYVDPRNLAKATRARELGRNSERGDEVMSLSPKPISRQDNVMSSASRELPLQEVTEKQLMGPVQQFLRTAFGRPVCHLY